MLVGLLAGGQQLVREVKDSRKGAGECGVEVIAGPGDPVVAVVDVRVCVVPRPEQVLDAQDVVG